MKSNRRRDTSPERKLRSAVWRRGLRFRVHSKLPGHPDIVFPSSRVVVFIDGCFWHGCAAHGVLPRTRREFWHSKLAANITRDNVTNRLLAAAKWHVVRVWEHEIRDAPERAADRVVRAVVKATTS